MKSTVDIKNQLQNLVVEIGKIPGVLGVILYGSYARNEPREGSDVDIAVIFKDKKTSDIASGKIIEISSKYRTLNQIVIFSKDELITSLLRRSLIRDGILLLSNNGETKESLLSMEVPLMSDKTHHEETAKEKLAAVKILYNKGYYSAVGDEAIKVLEQLIEACVAREDIHFHEHPASAPDKRKDWLKKNHPDLLGCWELLWRAYGELGYEGKNGELAKETVDALNKAVEELSKRENLNL